MKNIILLIIIFMELSYSYTASYECKDIKDDYILWLNIDHESLHGSSFIFKYKETTSLEKNRQLHLFNSKKHELIVYQNRTNPIKLYVNHYKNNKLKYQYICTLKHVIKDENNIPITWKDVKNNKELLEKFVDIVTDKGKIIERKN